MGGNRLRRSLSRGRKWNDEWCRLLCCSVRVRDAPHTIGFIPLVPVRSEGFHSGEDRPVTGAAADIAIEGFLDLFLGRLGIVYQELGHIHHESNAAVAAL